MYYLNYNRQYTIHEVDEDNSKRSLTSIFQSIVAFTAIKLLT